MDSPYLTTVIADSFFQQQLNRVSRTDTTLVGPSEAIKTLLLLYDIEVDSTSFAIAASQLDDIPVRVKVSPSVLDWDGTMADLLQILVVAGVGRLYLTNNGRVGFDTFREDSSPTITLTVKDDDIQQWVKVTDESMDPIEGFDVTTTAGHITSGDVEDRRQYDYGIDSPVRVVDAATAVYIGSTWETLSTRIYYRIELFLRKELSLIISLGNFIQLDSDKLALDKFAEVVGFDNGDARWVKITVLVDKDQ